MISAPDSTRKPKVTFFQLELSKTPIYDQLLHYIDVLRAPMVLEMKLSLQLITRSSICLAFPTWGREKYLGWWIEGGEVSMTVVEVPHVLDLA